EPLTQVMAKAEVCPRIPLCRLVPKPDSCTAANDCRAAVLHWMTLSAAIGAIGPTGSHRSHLSRPGIAPAGDDFGAHDVTLHSLPHLDLGSHTRKTFRNSSCQGGSNDDAPDAASLSSRRLCARYGPGTG